MNTKAVEGAGRADVATTTCRTSPGMRVNPDRTSPGMRVHPYLTSRGMRVHPYLTSLRTRALACRMIRPLDGTTVAW
ncbi:MAG: hypothetical protein KFH98_16100 [Gemmatimonadetes bacterium]|nr:hypothetical protein [Gemmatimonadota bacterium]